MSSRNRVFISVVFIVMGLLSAIIVHIGTTPEIVIPGRSVGYDIVAAGNYAFVSNNDGVVVIDKSIHNAPIRVANIPVNDGAFGLDIENNLLYIAGTSSGLVIADISNPLDPIILGQHISGVAVAVFVSSEYAYVANTGGILSIVDVSNSSAPEEIGAITVGSRSQDVAVVEDIAYFTDPDSGLVIVNVSNPSSPEIVQTITNSHGAWDICIHESILYLGCHGAGLRIFDISSPEAPTLLSSFNDGGEVYGVSGDGEYLAIADLQEGAEFLNVTDPQNPVEIAEYVNAAPHDVYYDGVYTYLADQDREFILIDFNTEDNPGYVVRTPSIEWFWVIPISLLLGGLAIIIIPILRVRMNDSKTE